MLGLSSKELRFAILISGIHFGQHFLMRLIPPLIPILTIALAYPLWQLGLLVSVFSLGAGLSQAPLGILSDRYDRLYLLPIGIGLLGFGYIVFAGAVVLRDPVPALFLLGYEFDGGFLVMCIGMMFAGIGSAVVHPVGYPMITANVASGNKGKVLGFFGSAAKFGDAAAPAVIAGAILVLLWHQILLILGILGVIFGIWLYVVLRSDSIKTAPASRSPASDEDGRPEAAQRPSRREYQYPLLVIYMFFISKKFAGEGIKTFLPVFIVVVYAYTLDTSGLYLGPESVANLYFASLLIFAGVSQLGMGMLTDMIDKRYILLGGTGMAALGFLALSLLNLGPLFLILVLFMIGGGIYGLAPARDAFISDVSPPELEGRTFGYIWTAISLTGVVMPPTVGYVIEVWGMREGFLVLTGGLVLAMGSVALLFVKRLYTPSGHRNVV